MRTSSTHRTISSRLLLAAIITLCLAACSHGSAPTATPRDRAACTQLGDAYTSFNAWHGGVRPTATYQKAIAVAQRADNKQLRTAIVSWVQTMLTSRIGTSVSGATYATEECRQIGLPLRFGTGSTSPLQSPTPGPTPTTDGGGDSGD
jgi:hypothetical protein